VKSKEKCIISPSTILLQMKENILRRGRLIDMDERAVRFTSSMLVDKWLFEYDIMVDKVHVAMLKKQGIISDEAASSILKGLEIIREKGYDSLNKDAEDVHIAIESALIDMIGEEYGGMLHVGRSRNDEVATCIRMAVREQIMQLMAKAVKLKMTLLKKAAENAETVIPGFTHLQHAQPTTLAHHLLAHYDAIGRDLARLSNCFNRTNTCPLGAAAFASSGFPLDRDFVAVMLGFEGIVENSMDAVSTRDYAIECLATLSNIMINISRIAEEFILWSTSEFGYVEINDRYASTSSIMPQKKNPDSLELVRAKTGSVAGNLTSVLTICKALPYSYNLDLQEVTVHLEAALRNTIDSIVITTGVLDTVKFKKELLNAESSTGFTTATELADMIVTRTKISFRTAHAIVGELARTGTVDLEALDVVSKKRCGKTLSSLGLTQKDVACALDPVFSIKRRNVKGGPSPDEVRRMVNSRCEEVKKENNEVLALSRRLNKVYSSLKNLTED
jgi:argininosuccinate lyase